MNYIQAATRLHQCTQDSALMHQNSCMTQICWGKPSILDFEASHPNFLGGRNLPGYEEESFQFTFDLKYTNSFDIKILVTL